MNYFPYNTGMYNMSSPNFAQSAYPPLPTNTEHTHNASSIHPFTPPNHHFHHATFYSATASPPQHANMHHQPFNTRNGPCCSSSSCKDSSTPDPPPGSVTRFDAPLTVSPLSPPLRPNEHTRSVSPEELQNGPRPAHKRYKCDHCGKAFSRPSSLATHMSVHTGARPFHCTYPGCNKAFSVRSNLKRHYKIHKRSSGDLFSGTVVNLPFSDHVMKTTSLIPNDPCLPYTPSSHYSAASSMTNNESTGDDSIGDDDSDSLSKCRRGALHAPDNHIVLANYHAHDSFHHLTPSAHEHQPCGVNQAPSPLPHSQPCSSFYTNTPTHLSMNEPLLGLPAVYANPCTVIDDQGNAQLLPTPSSATKPIMDSAPPRKRQCILSPSNANDASMDCDGQTIVTVNLDANRTHNTFNHPNPTPTINLPTHSNSFRTADRSNRRLANRKRVPQTSPHRCMDESGDTSSTNSMAAMYTHSPVSVNLPVSSNHEADRLSECTDIEEDGPAVMSSIVSSFRLRKRRAQSDQPGLSRSGSPDNCELMACADQQYFYYSDDDSISILSATPGVTAEPYIQDGLIALATVMDSARSRPASRSASRTASLASSPIVHAANKRANLHLFLQASLPFPGALDETMSLPARASQFSSSATPTQQTSSLGFVFQQPRPFLSNTVHSQYASPLGSPLFLASSMTGSFAYGGDFRGGSSFLASRSGSSVHTMTSPSFHPFNNNPSSPSFYDIRLSTASSVAPSPLLRTPRFTFPVASSATKASNPPSPPLRTPSPPPKVQAPRPASSSGRVRASRQLQSSLASHPNDSEQSVQATPTRPRGGRPRGNSLTSAKALTSAEKRALATNTPPPRRSARLRSSHTTPSQAGSPPPPHTSDSTMSEPGPVRAPHHSPCPRAMGRVDSVLHVLDDRVCSPSLSTSGSNCSSVVSPQLPNGQDWAARKPTPPPALLLQQVHPARLNRSLAAARGGSVEPRTVRSSRLQP